MQSYECFQIEIRDTIAVVAMSRGKVNAVNEKFVAEMSAILSELAAAPAVKAVVLTGRGKFFSFGLDIPEMYDYPPDSFTRFIRQFCNLYCEMFLYPKPLIAAVNGHAVAGGCILALACDYRVTVEGNARMALNEVTFGASLFAGAVAMLRYAAGNRNAESILLTGRMFTPSEALELGLADAVVAESELMPEVLKIAAERAAHFGPQYTSLKRLARRPVADAWRIREDQSIREWIETWYSPDTRQKTRSIQIRG